MICKQCGNEIDGSVKFCTCCGAQQFFDVPPQSQSAENASFDGNAAGYSQGRNVPPYQNNGYPNNYPDNREYYSNVNKIPTSKEYLKWMLLYPLLNLIPVVGTIIYLVFCFKYALDKTYPAKASFFKSVLIAFVICICVGIAISILVSVVVGILGFAVTDFIYSDEIIDIMQAAPYY